MCSMQEKCIQGKIYLLSIFYGVFPVQEQMFSVQCAWISCLPKENPELGSYNVWRISKLAIFWWTFIEFHIAYLPLFLPLFFPLQQFAHTYQKKLKACTGSIFFVFISLFNCHKMCYHKLLKFCKSPEFCRNCAFQCENCSQLF